MKILKALKALLKQKPDRLQPIEPSEMNYLVAGLGNIGDEYASTRHNMGFMVLDAWAQASNAVFDTERYGDVAIMVTCSSSATTSICLSAPSGCARAGATGATTA